MTFLDGDGVFSQSLEVVRRHLRTNRSRRLLVGAINDPSVALDILHHRPVPPAVFAKHELVTPENVNHLYPNDDLLLVAPGATG